MIMFWIHMRQNPVAGTDFLSFFTGGRLAVSPELYSEAAMRRIQKDIGYSRDFFPYVRLPWCALALYPLTALPFPLALTFWRALNLLAVAGFVLFWEPPRIRALLACAWSFPLLINLSLGQDVPLLLFCLALSLFLLRRSWPVAAGLVLALLSAKFHLFLLLPLLLARRRLFKVFLGLAAGGLALAAMSFMAAGPDWPVKYAHLILSDMVNPRPWDMYNLRALFAHLPGALYLELGTAVIVVVLTWRCFRSRDLGYSAAAALIGGLLCGHHSYLGDTALLIPAGLLVRPRARHWGHRVMAILLLLPVLYLLPSPNHLAVPLLVIGLLVAMSLRSWPPHAPDGTVTPSLPSLPASSSRVPLNDYGQSQPHRRLRLHRTRGCLLHSAVHS